MSDFKGIDLIHKKDGIVTRIAPVRNEERQRHAELLAKQLRSEGNNEVEAYAAIKACNLVSYRPMLSDEEINSIIKPIFEMPLSCSGLGRNRHIWELIKEFKKRNLTDDEILRRIHFFNSRCCGPILSDDDIKQLIHWLHVL